jgi:hypothetical protein
VLVAEDFQGLQVKGTCKDAVAADVGQHSYHARPGGTGVAQLVADPPRFSLFDIWAGDE